jgi:hypothetical protein
MRESVEVPAGTPLAFSESERPKGDPVFPKLGMLAPVLGALLALGCSSEAGGAGGMTADCALSGEWENKGSWGTATSTYGNVVLMQNPIDDSLWQAVLRVDETVADKLDIALFRSVDVGESWNEIASWEFPGERRGWPSDAAMAADGTIFVVLGEYTVVDGAATDRFVKLLRYAPGGDLEEAGVFNPEGSTDTRSATITTRGSEAWFIAYDVTPVPPDWHIVKYANGMLLGSFDVIRYGQNVFVRDLAVAPNGKIWTVGQGHVNDSEVWRATIWEEGESSFSLLAEFERTPGVEEADTMMALAFDADDRFWTSYYTIHEGAYRWRAGYGMANDPQSTFALRDEFALDESKSSQTQHIAIHPSGEVFTGGYAVDVGDMQWGIVRRGTTNAFAPSDEFNHDESGDFKTAVSSILADTQGNVWVAYMSRPSTGWSPKLTTLRTMACVR